MKLNVYATILDDFGSELAFSDAVVIDVLRMTSTAVSALQNGAKGICLVGSEEKARALSKEKGALLGGERGGVKLPGFAFGNSPLEYIKERVENKNIVMTTTNGARAAEAARGAKSVALMSFINVSAVYEYLKNKENITVICAGTHDRFSLDDCLCAGALSSLLKPDEENDLSVSMRLLYEAHKDDVHRALRDTKHYRYLKSIGFTDDLEYCLKRDTHTCVPVLNDEGWFTV